MKPDNFATEKELKNYVILAIRDIGVCASLKEKHPTHFTFFTELFQRHPEKERKEVHLLTDISIRRFPKAKGPLDVTDYQFFIHKSNGTRDSISWVSCVKGKGNPVGKKLGWAMRQAIESQIIDFKIANKKTPCELCGTSANLTVDHVKKFKDIKEEFLQANPGSPTVFAKNELAQEIFREEDSAFRHSWETYHKEHASLRILCKPCNQNLDAYGADFI